MFFKKKTKRAFEVWSRYTISLSDWKVFIVDWAYVNWLFNPKLAYEMWMTIIF